MSGVAVGLVLHWIEHGIFCLVHVAVRIIHNYQECRADNDNGRRGRRLPIWMGTIGMAGYAAAVGCRGGCLHNQ